MLEKKEKNNLQKNEICDLKNQINTLTEMLKKSISVS